MKFDFTNDKFTSTKYGLIFCAKYVPEYKKYIGDTIERDGKSYIIKEIQQFNVSIPTIDKNGKEIEADIGINVKEIINE